MYYQIDGKLTNAHRVSALIVKKEPRYAGRHNRRARRLRATALGYRRYGDPPEQEK